MGKTRWLMAVGSFWLFWSLAHAGDKPRDVAALMEYLDRQMMSVNQSLIQDDLGGLHAAAVAVADHPMLPMGERVKVLSNLGPDAPAFRAHDSRMQQAARKLADAALENDRQAIGKSLWELIEACSGCHREFGHRFAGTRDGK